MRHLNLRLAAICVVPVATFALSGCSSDSKDPAPSIPATAAPLPVETKPAKASAESSVANSAADSAAVSDSTEASKSSEAAVSEDPKVAMLQFTKCVRSKGVEVSDPDASGNIPNFPSGALADDAIKACERYLKAVSAGPGGALTPEMKQQFLDLAKCMRETIPDFPDPIISDNGVSLPGGLNPNDPKYADALNACSKKLNLNLGGPQ